MQVVLHPEAQIEIRAAVLWYEAREPGYGDRFVESIDDAMRRIALAPGAYPLWPGTEAARFRVHRALAERFPYLVAFEVHPEHLLVLAVAHAKRQPLYWLARSGEQPPR